MSNQRVVLAGGSGFLGQALATRFLQKNYDVVVLSRGRSNSHSRTPQPQVTSDANNGSSGSYSVQTWDGTTLGPWSECLDGAQAVINLTGKSINCRLTTANRLAIVESRVHSVAVLATATRNCKHPPEVFVQTSAVGIYGDRANELCDESSPPGSGFLAATCTAWEKSLSDEQLPGVRRVILRLGVVLGRQGGAFPLLASLTRWLLGGAVGNGRQYVSWLHLDDAEALYLAAIEQPTMQGVYVAASPEPITNAELMRQLRTALHRPWSPPAPAIALQLVCRVIDANADLILQSQRCRPSRLLAEGYEFAYPELAPAVESLLRHQLNAPAGR